MISIIIPSYNSETTISKCLNGLLNQNYSGEYEIILVDSSVDRTPQIVRADFPQIKYIHLPEKTDPGTARNIGVKESKGDPILFIDSDCIAEPDWIEQFTAMHQSSDYDAIGGAVVNGNDHSSNIAWAGYLAEFREFLPEYPRREVEHIPTCNLSFKRRVFDKHKGFNPDYYPQEDLEFNHRMRLAGGKVLFIPSARVHHNHRTDIKSFFNHQKRVGNITSFMLNILPLQGSSIARSLFKTLLAIPLLPLVKWVKTVKIFVKYQPRTLIRHPLAALIFAVGLFPWSQGFIQGIYRFRNQNKVSP